jgi:hypothetical protein
VDKVALIPGTVNSTDKNFGLKPCENLENVFKLVGTGFQEGILANMDFKVSLHNSEGERSVREIEVEELEGMLDTKLHEPNLNILELDINSEINRMITKITEEVIYESDQQEVPFTDEEIAKKVNERVDPYRKLITEKHNVEFVERNKKYLKDSENQSEAKRMLRKCKKEREKALIYEAILTAYGAATFQIVTKMKNEFKNVHIIQQ